MYKYIFIYIITLLFIGCSTKDIPLTTVKKVQLNKYTGTWYEIARFEHFFEKGCKNVTASYSIKSDGDIKVINRCTKIENGEIKEAEGTAYSVDESNSKLKVSFFRPFYGDYYIIDLAKDYSYALVGNPNRKYLWILSRTKTISQSVKQKLLNKASVSGFDTDRFIWTIQE